LRIFGRGSHRRVPVKDSIATVAGEQLALAQLIPHLGTDAHAAAHTLLIVYAGQTGAAGGAETVETGEPLRFDERAEGLALGVEGAKLGGKLLLAKSDAGAGSIVCGRQNFDLSARLGEGGFEGFSAFEAGKLLVFEAVAFAGLKMNLMLDGLSLGGSLHGVKLGAEPGGFLAVLRNFALKAGAPQRARQAGRVSPE
jgi:hypothetical protein